MDADKESVGGGGGIGLSNTRNNNKSGKFGRNANSSGGSQGAGAGTVVIGGYMDTGKADRTMWLMKCPPVVSRSLQPAPLPPALMGYGDGGSGGNGRIPPPPPSRPVAKVILSFDPLRSHEDNSTEFTMELASTESGNIPKRYSLEMSKDFVPMSVFSESAQGKVTVEGKILNKFDMRPHDENIENYGKLCRERTNKYMKKGRQIQVIDHDNRNLIRPMPWMEKKKAPVKTSEMKRTRKDRGEMEDIMFKLFERQPNWTLRQLIQETDQPEQFLKDILKDLCVYNNKGAHQGTYELKPEYRKSSDDPPL